MAKPNESARYQWSPVHWYEGMFLRPHHLQAADRHARDMLAASEDWYHPFNFGYRSLNIDRDALRDRRVRLLDCEARFPDGTKLSIPGDGAPDEVVLRDDRYKRAQGLDVLLGVPRWRRNEGRPNVENDPAAHAVRYAAESAEVEDEGTGGNEQGVEFRRLRSRLILDGQAHDGYVTMPLARLIQAATGHPIPDPGFVPPALTFDASPQLYRPVQALHRQISTRIDALIARLPDSGRLYETQDTGEAERVLKLMALDGAYAHLGSLAYTPGVTPLAVYHELCRLAGSLAIFTPARRPAELPRYDHEALARCFSDVCEEVRRGLDAATYSAYDYRPFEGAPGGTPDRPTIDQLAVGFDPEWRGRGRALFLGVRGVDSELTAEECDEILGRIDMKLGGAAGVGASFTQRLLDIRLVHVSSERPRVLPPGYVYYRLDADEGAWRDVVESRSLVVQVNRTRVVPEVRQAAAGGEAEGDAAEAAGSPTVRVLGVDGRRISFSLFIL